MLFTILFSAVLIGLDQLFKWLASVHLQPVGRMDLIPGFIELQYIENTGAAFNLLAGRQLLLIIVTGIAMLVVAYILLFRRPAGRMEYMALLCIFAGGVGNLIDRIANGYVVDYLNFQFISFPVFNLADILVCVGFGLLLVAVIYSEFILPKRKGAKGEGVTDEGAAKSGADDKAETLPEDEKGGG